MNERKKEGRKEGKRDQVFRFIGVLAFFSLKTGLRREFSRLRSRFPTARGLTIAAEAEAAAALSDDAAVDDDAEDEESDKGDDEIDSLFFFLLLRSLFERDGEEEGEEGEER